LLHLDKLHEGTPSWNPLGDLISPGQTVLLKPNLIRESHVTRVDEWQQVITHGSVIRTIIDYVVIALKGNGRIIIADGPQTDSDFEAICERNGLFSIAQFFHDRGIEIEVMDFRRDRWFQKGDVIYKRVSLPGDPAGYTRVDLGPASEFGRYSLNGRFYGADYDMNEAVSFHSEGRHAYVLCRTAMDADVLINIPKLKTHKKTGVTLSLKNLVGINGYRNCLPHHTIGTPAQRGDEFATSDASKKIQSMTTASFKRMLAGIGGSAGGWARAVKFIGRHAFGDTEKVIRSGNWFGNDTAWRMVLDLNKIFFNFEGTGELRSRERTYLTVVDGVIAGHRNGPAAPDSIGAGIIACGANPVAVDTVCTTLMGFNYEKIALIREAWKVDQYPLVKFPLKDVVCVSNNRAWNGSVEHLKHAPNLSFEPHFGWIGKIELTQSEAAGVR